VSITPDGSAIVFDARDQAGTGAQIYSMVRSADAQVRPLTSDGANSDPMLDPSGEGIVFVSDRTGGPTLWSMTIDGADQRPLFVASIE
jgi:Tol biopolymer transport system component